MVELWARTLHSYVAPVLEKSIHPIPGPPSLRHIRQSAVSQRVIEFSRGDDKLKHVGHPSCCQNKVVLH